MVNKKAQIKTQQMAFMLMAVTLFLVLAGLFILVIRFSSLRESAELLDERNALLLVSKIADSPEFACGDSFGEAKSNCIDMDKVMALKSRLGSYSGFWGVDGIEIRQVFPSDSSSECTVNNYPNCGKITILSADSGTGISNFVSLCRKESRSFIDENCVLGRIIVTYNEND